MAEVTLDQVPRKTREVFDKASSALERGNLDYAIDMFLALLDTEPRLLQARRALRAAQITKFRAGGGAHPAKRILTKLATAGSVLRANMALSKKPLEALQAAERLLGRDPFLSEFYTLQARAAEAAGLPEAALVTLEMVREAQPNDLILLRWLGRIYKSLQKTAEARECFELVASMRPNDPQAIKDLKDSQAMDTMQQGRWDQAGEKGDFRKVMRDEGEAKRIEQESKAVKTGSDLDSLIEEMRSKITQEPQNVNYRRALADYLAKADRLDEALASLEESSTLSGGGDPQIDRAITAIRIRQFDQKIESLRAGDRTAEADRAVQERETFRFSDTEERVRRYPNDLQFKYDLGVLLFERERFTEAIHQFQLAQRNPQRRLRALYYLALCFKAKAQYDIAFEQLEKAKSESTTMDDSRKDILYELGEVSGLMGQPEKAAGFFKEIYSVDIGFRDVAARIENAYKKPSGDKA
jgi:tetratricopeptide (TPR) repeat protein